MTGWVPSDEEEYAILLEDDVQVAPGFLEWALYCVSFMNMRRLVEGEEHGMMGCSFYTPRVDEIGPAPNAWSPPPWSASSVIGQSHLFYFQLPCSWGAIYHAKHWTKFLRYFHARHVLESAPEIPASRSNEWFSSWKRYAICSANRKDAD